ncbi:hypothetical protein CCAX7_32240 [Capsulimonas corticalis]|uniref:Uncharacterized protein n=1 Tax=Capsulimonas corticalis TaxID=2219043 RepID=A0A402D496_9BACT|nr:hypothetical protein CCAX7_32240 [Capsulimonas corticalis]
MVDWEDTAQLVDWGYFADGSEAEVARKTAIYEAALAGESFDCSDFRSYFDKILEIFADHRVELILENDDPLD